MWDRTYLAGKSAAARNTSAEPEGLRSTPSKPMKEASVVPEMDRAWCAASYHDAPFIRARTSNHNSTSGRNSLLAVTGILANDGEPFGTG